MIEVELSWEVPFGNGKAAKKIVGVVRKVLRSTK